MSNLTVAQHIFQIPYAVSIPNMFFYSKEYLEQVGMLTTGKSEYDTTLMNERRDLYLPIAGMVIYHAQGASVRLHRGEDSVVIYKLLKEHLNNWREVSLMLNAPDAPVADLQKMDSFASDLYPIASSYNAEIKIPESGLWSGPMRLFGRREPVVAATEKRQIIDPGHSMISDAIARSSFMRKRQ